MSVLGFKARVNPFLHAFSAMGSSDSPLVQHLLTIEVSMEAKPFWAMYLQMCLQALVEVQAMAQTHNHLCGEHSAVYHSATPARLGKIWFVLHSY